MDFFLEYPCAAAELSGEPPPTRGWLLGGEHALGRNGDVEHRHRHLDPGKLGHRVREHPVGDYHRRRMGILGVGAVVRPGRPAGTGPVLRGWGRGKLEVGGRCAGAPLPLVEQVAGLRRGIGTAAANARHGARKREVRIHEFIYGWMEGSDELFAPVV